MVFGGLVGVYWLLGGSPATGQTPVTPTTTRSGVASTVDPTSTPPPAERSGASASPAAPAVATSCATGLSAAAGQRQQRDLAAAAATLEGLRSSGCDVTEPLYEAYLEHGRDLADAERTDEAITRFDQALQVKSTDDARQARSLAAAYRDGRGAIDRRSWDEAVQKLDLVHRTSPAYARGKIVAHLKAALVAKGDELRRQGRAEEALEAYQRAQALRPDDTEVAARVRDSEVERDRRRTAEAAAREPTATPVPPPTATTPPAATPIPASTPADLERVAHAYYAALNARRYDEAYALLSARARQQQSLDQFRARFTNTLGIRVREIVNARVQGTSGTMTVRTETRNATPQGEQIACSRVEWALILETQGWRRDIVSGSGNEQGERC